MNDAPSEIQQICDALRKMGWQTTAIDNLVAENARLTEQIAELSRPENRGSAVANWKTARGVE